MDKLSQYTKICPSCGRAFECRVDDIEQCQCYGIQLQPETRLAIANRFSSCLCSRCLLDMEEQISAGKVNDEGLI
jgi:hypothetical protein